MDEPQRQRRPGGGSEQVARVSAADTLALAAVEGTKTFVKSHPVLTASWVLGLMLSVFAAGFAPAPEALQAYEAKLDSLEPVTDELAKAEERTWRAQQSYERSKGWFSCDSHCQLNKRDYELAKGHFEGLRAEYMAGVSDAKKEVGLFSEYGVGQAKDLFWSKLAGGQAFAKRATLYSAVRSALFVGMRRDQGLGEYLMQLAFNFLINLTLGLVGALVTFLVGVWNVIFEYQPDPLSATLFFLACALGAFSIVATWMLGLAAVSAGAVYGVAKAAEASMLEQERAQAEGRGGPGGQPGGQWQGRRIHYD